MRSDVKWKNPCMHRGFLYSIQSLLYITQNQNKVLRFVIRSPCKIINISLPIRPSIDIYAKTKHRETIMPGKNKYQNVTEHACTARTCPPRRRSCAPVPPQLSTARRNFARSVCLRATSVSTTRRNLPHGRLTSTENIGARPDGVRSLLRVRQYQPRSTKGGHGARTGMRMSTTSPSESRTLPYTL